MASSTPYGSNTYAPSAKATGGMLVGYSRNIDKFPLNKYMQIIPVDKDHGLYYEWASKEGARVLSTDDREHLWPDGQDAPHGRDELESFAFKSYRAVRRAYPFTLGDLSVKQADFPVLEAHSKVASQKCMTARTLLSQQALANYSWSGIGHQFGVNGGILTKGKGWDNGTTTSPNILNTLTYVTAIIHRDTIGGVDPEDLILVVGPDLARQMAGSAEIHDYLARSPFAAGRMMGTDKKLNPVNRYGLPAEYGGYTIVIEDTPRISSAKGATTDVNRYIMPYTEAYILSRPGGLIGVAGGPNFSTLQGFFKEEMTVEIKNDPDNRRTRGRIVTHYDIKVVAPASGAKLTDIVSADSSLV